MTGVALGMGVDVKEHSMRSSHVLAPPRTRHGTIGSVNLNATRGAAGLVRSHWPHSQSLFFLVQRQCSREDTTHPARSWSGPRSNFDGE